MGQDMYGSNSSDSESESDSESDSSDNEFDLPGDDTIWNNTVRPIPFNWVGRDSSASKQRPTQASDEVWRFKSMSFLRNKFDKSCNDVDGLTTSPPQAFERWVFNCDLTRNSLPQWNLEADKTLCSELKQAGAHTKEANGIAHSMKRYAKRANHTLNSAGRNGSTKRQVVMTIVERDIKTPYKSTSSTSTSTATATSTSTATSSATIDIVEPITKHMVRLSYGKTKVHLTTDHFAKLLEMYRLHNHGSLAPTEDHRTSQDAFSTSSSSSSSSKSSNNKSRKRSRTSTTDIDIDDTNGAPRSHELDSIFTVVLRYNTLVGPQTQGAGFQAALNGECFDVLLQHFGARMECFASPLNSRYRTFCSAYSDTDLLFGSYGSFFNFYPKRGSYEANPPFVGHVMNQMVSHMLELLEKATADGEPLQFIIIIPCWKNDTSHKRLENRCGPHMRHHLIVKQRDHGYTEGAQWSKMDSRFRISTCDTSVFFLQTPKACKKWVITEAKLTDLTHSFRSKHRGDGDDDGGDKDEVVEEKDQSALYVKVDPFKSKIKEKKKTEKHKKKRRRQ